MAITDEEKSLLKKEILDEIKASSQGVLELEKVTALSGVNSLPAMQGTKVVLVPLPLLSKPAEDAAAVALAAASEAADATAETEDVADVTRELAKEMAAATAQTKSATAAAEGIVAEFNAVAETALGGTSLFNVNARCGDATYTLETALQALAAQEMNDGVTYRKKGLVVTYRIDAAKWETRQFIGATLDDWTQEALWQGFGSGSGAGNVYNVTALLPLDSGYYTLATALAAVAREKGQARGLVLTFAVSDGEWQSYQFIGATLDGWNDTAQWREFGSGVRSVTVNGGGKMQPDGDGNVDIPVPTVDDSLDAESTNPVENAAVARRLNEIDASTVFGMTADLNDDESSVRLSLTNKSGAEIAGVDIPAGGGGGGESVTTKIVLSAGVDHPVVKEGGSVRLTYTYDHQYAAGDDAGTTTGQKATIRITASRGSVEAFGETVQDVSKGSYTLDLTPYLQAGVTDIYVRATTTDPETGRQQSKQAYVSVRVVALSLSSSYNLAAGLAAGGYGAEDTAVIPFTVSGSGTKVVTLYVDGRQYDTATVTKSGTTNGSFSLPMSGLSAGRHTVQMVAEVAVSDESSLRSESVYLDLLRRGAGGAFIGTMHRFADGRIFTDEHLSPRLSVGRYEQLAFDFVAYDPAQTPAAVSIFENDTLTQDVSVPRTTQRYANRFSAQGAVTLRFLCRGVEYVLPVTVEPSDIDIEETTADLRLRLSAAGRSNAEADPATWSYGDVQSTFEGFDWSSSGWTGDVLRMRNGARVEIGMQPFAADATSTGATYEFELRCSNVTDRDGEVLSCLAEGIGFRLTAQEALLTASGGTQVGTKFAPDIDLKIGFVVGAKSGHRLLELYVNGVRCGAKQYASTESLLQAAPAGISIGSAAADVDLRMLRVYDRALSDDEMLSNYIVDRLTTEEMVHLYRQNDVLDDEGDDIGIEKLRAQGKSVFRIVGDVELVNETNNKKFEVPVDLYFYSAYGKEYDFVARNIGLRIQGTSSTTYPRKNYRLYFDRREKYGTTLEVNGADVPDLKYSFKPGARPVSIFCLKADFSDSSSTHNTGAVRLIADTYRKCGYLTPPQRAYTGAYDVRIGVDGFPCDGFYDNDGSGTIRYLGKFNFNNEKSESHDVYGFEGIEGFNDAATLGGERNKCLCLEFLNNSAPLCLFATDDMTSFDDALEFRYKPDQTWATAHADDKAAVQRLWSWVKGCENDAARFAAEVDQYFDVEFLCAWYLFTDYLMAVDNRAKNMMFATWDGLVWHPLPYDLDTILGGRNDSLLAYLYTITHETFDDSIGSYAFAGHDSVLWKLVREGLGAKLIEVAGALRSNMSTDDVLRTFNEEQMGNWSERVYNKDGHFKYIQPLTEGVLTSEGRKHYDYLYALQGSRYAHRVYTIRNRFALLDAQYVAGTYRADSFAAYFGYKFSEDKRKIRITASERYYFGYGYTSGTPKQSAVLAADAGSTVELTMDADLIVNDPQYFYGASRMQGLDLSGVSMALLQTLNLNNCTALRTLNVSCAQSQTTLAALIVTNCLHLRTLNVSGLKSSSFTSLDLSNNLKLESLVARNTSLRSVAFAAGAPLTTATLPATLQSLELVGLNSLPNTGLTLQGTASIARLVIDGCALIDWQELLARCPAVQYLRVTGVDIEDDGSLLRSLASMGGVDEQGGNTPTCRLVGRCRLTQYMDEEELAAMQTHFPELTIEQPAWTCIEFDDAVSDPANISNLDNRTGYRFDTPYVPSGHIARILAQRHRCLGKKTAAGEVTIFPLHDGNSNYYADADDVSLATPAVLTGRDGNVWMYEPHYWCKGVNDLLNQKKYAFFSSDAECPAVDGVYVKLTKEQVEVVAGKAIRIAEEYTTLDEAVTTIAANSYCTVPVAGYRQVRFPSMASAAYGAVWLDAAGTILGRLRATSSAGILNGMYLFATVPEGAERLAFTIVTAADFDYVLLTTSDKIEAIEPDWVEDDEFLCAVYEALLQDDFMKSISGEISTGTVSQADLKVYAANSGPGFQLIDWDMHCAVANLFYAKYGTRDSQGQCGYGQSSYNKRSGLTNMLGMRDTINPEGKTTGAYYYEGETLKDAYSTNVLGYECWQGDKCEWLEGVTLNKEKADGRWSIETPGRAPREVQGIAAFAEYWPANMVFGRHMDLIVARGGGSETSHYCDWQNVSSSTRRVVYRSNSYAYANGGVSYASTHYDSSSTSASIGSRLAFRGKVVKATSVSEYKALPSVE